MEQYLNAETSANSTVSARAIGMAAHLDGYIGQISQGAGVEESERIERARQVFLSDVEFGITPIERIAQIYETLSPAVGEEEQFQQAVQAHSTELLERAFDQHLGSPERFVSHDYPHTIRIANYSNQIINRGYQPALDVACDRYGLDEGTARFVFELIALSHDFGYPYLGTGTKAYHSFPAVEIISTPKMRDLHKQLIRTTKDHSELMTTIYDAILRHGADKIEDEFPLGMLTKGGKQLLGYSESVAQMQLEGADNAVVIIVRDQEAAEKVKKDLSQAAEEYQSRVGQKLIIPEIKVVEGPPFQGRRITADSGDAGYGVEFLPTDILKDPFRAVVRLADNMDITSDRLTPNQKAAIERQMDNPGEINDSFPHFGGCLAVKHIMTVGPLMHVTVDPGIFEKLNKIRVKEDSPEGPVDLGVGEYQIARTQEALKSVTVGGRPFLIIVEGDGKLINLRDNGWT